MQTLVKAGRPLSEVLAAKPTAEFDAKWGRAAVTAEQFVTMAFEVVSRPMRRLPVGDLELVVVTADGERRCTVRARDLAKLLP